MNKQFSKTDKAQENYSKTNYGTNKNATQATQTNQKRNSYNNADIETNPTPSTNEEDS